MLHGIRFKYGPLLKSWQTALLVLTGLAGYLSAGTPTGGWGRLLGLVGSQLLAIGGGTALNMWFDRDLDAKMARTCHRPLPAGQVTQAEALGFGATLSVLGVGWAMALSPLYGALGAAGWLLETAVYTLWLKRRTAWSVVWGGLAGCVPILAGRALASGGVDTTGLLLALAVWLWIPTHNLTLALLHTDDYRQADVPTFASTFGLAVTRRLIAFSSVLAAVVMTATAAEMGLPAVRLWLLVGLGAGLLALALRGWGRPSTGADLGLYRYASVYMLSCMALLALGAR
jgi:protoheme IX farnesyltransferase